MKPDMPTMELRSCPLNLTRNRVGASGSGETGRPDKADLRKKGRREPSLPNATLSHLDLKLLAQSRVESAYFVVARGRKERLRSLLLSTAARDFPTLAAGRTIMRCEPAR